MIEKISAIGSRAKTGLTSAAHRVTGAVSTAVAVVTNPKDQVSISSLARKEHPEIDPKNLKTTGLLGAFSGVLGEAPLALGIVGLKAAGVAVPAAVAVGAVVALPIAGAAVAVGAALYLRHRQGQSNN